MKRKNITAFVFGVIAAGLLWQFYLKPKYDIHTGDKEAVALLHQADVDALEQATSELQGELIYSSAGGEEVKREDLLDTSSAAPESFEFQSNANKPLDPYQQAARGDKRRETKIVLDSNNILVKPDAAAKMPDPISEEELKISQDQELKNRLSIIKAPVKYHLIKNQNEYDAFKKQNAGPYNAKVNFAKEMLLLLESDSRLSSGFFEIDEVLEEKNTLDVYYRVSIIGTSGRQDIMPYKVLPKSNKKISLKQIK